MILARPKLRSHYEFYIWDSDDIVIDFVDGDGDGSPNPSLDNRYLWGPAVDQLLADEDYEYDAERAPAQAAQTTSPPAAVRKSWGIALPRRARWQTLKPLPRDVARTLMGNSLGEAT